MTETIPIKFGFINEFQKNFFNETKRNQCASGGYGNGKTTILCLKAQTLALTFPKYRIAIFRKKSKDLVNTTMVTFFKTMPKEAYDDKHGGRWAQHEGHLRLINGSEFLFLHLENYDENLVRGLEINTVVIDQAEEIGEYIGNHIDGRIGRWDGAQIPAHMNEEDFPLLHGGVRQVPAYMLLGCNPDSKEHWIYKRYHPDSDLHHELQVDAEGNSYKYSDTHVMHQAVSSDNPALTPEYVSTLKKRGDTFYKRFFLGQWGIAEGTIHKVPPTSILDNPPKEIIERIIQEGTKFRVMDHGMSAPTACLWFSIWKGFIFVYREYYVPAKLISEHRQSIFDLSEDETYAANWADPAIFKKNSEKYGGFWTVADDYTDSRIDAPTLFWSPADNNERRCRNAIDELFLTQEYLVHPITGENNCARIFFIKRSITFPNACAHVISETRAARRIQIDTVQGEATFSDERDKGVADHAYDCLRYFSVMRPRGRDARENPIDKSMTYDFVRRSAIDSGRRQDPRTLMAQVRNDW